MHCNFCFLTKKRAVRAGNSAFFSKKALFAAWIVHFLENTHNSRREFGFLAKKRIVPAGNSAFSGKYALSPPVFVLPDEKTHCRRAAARLLSPKIVPLRHANDKILYKQPPRRPLSPRRTPGTAADTRGGHLPHPVL